MVEKTINRRRVAREQEINSVHHQLTPLPPRAPVNSSRQLSARKIIGKSPRIRRTSSAQRSFLGATSGRLLAQAQVRHGFPHASPILPRRRRTPARQPSTNLSLDGNLSPSQSVSHSVTPAVTRSGRSPQDFPIPHRRLP